MSKRGFNIVVEPKFIDLLVAYGKIYGTSNKTEAFRKAMLELEVLHHSDMHRILELQRREKQLAKTSSNREKT